MLRGFKLAQTAFKLSLLATSSAALMAQEPASPPPNPGAAPTAPMPSDGVARVSEYPVNCGPNGCRSGACNSVMGHCPNGMCFASPNACMSPEALAGRPYTFGDLRQDMYSLKCDTRDCLGMSHSGGGAVSNWWANECYKHRCHNAYSRQVWSAHFHNKLNYFTPSGCGGAGCPPFGIYKRVYPVQPDYMDPRDGQIYAAPATGVPTAVPLPPNVRYQMNYGWGTPSSRLTQISNYQKPAY